MTSISENLAAEMASEFGAKVIDFTKPSSEEKAERLVDLHQKEEALCRQRIVDARRTMRMWEVAFKAEEVNEIARHKAAMEDIARKRAKSLEEGKRKIEADEKLAAYNRSSVDQLTALWTAV